MFLKACAVSLIAFSALKAAALDPSLLQATGKIDPHFQSFNIEMVEVTGGRFWRPYADQAKAPDHNGGAPAGMDPALFEFRHPIDLTNPRLRKLAAALSPFYLRVSGTWANSSYFQTATEPVPATPPSGFNSVLTRQQWKGVVDFSKAVNAPIVTSFATSAGTRDTSGVWTSGQASEFLAYTKSLGGSIAAAEFMNEPTFAEMGGAPKGYNAAAYARDVAVFRLWVRHADPSLLILGPGSVGEGVSLGPVTASIHLLSSESLLEATAPIDLNAFSYHFYGAVSKRCSGPGDPGVALSAEYLSRTDKAFAFYSSLRDRFAAGKPIWITETGEAACGGDSFASTFLDSFRYLDQLGSMAQRGVQVVAHNTLAASDYGLLDEKTLAPRPNYWSALLWHELMGTTVLNPGPSPDDKLHTYAHCLQHTPGGVALLVINTDQSSSHAFPLTQKSTAYVLTAQNLQAASVSLNGVELKLKAGGALPKLSGKSMKKGQVQIAPASISFFAFPKANNLACR